MPADQPFCPLGSLTQTSGTSADFLGRVFNPKASKYSYKAKGDGKLIEKTKLSCILLGEDAGHYCEAIIKASAAEVAQALEKYLHGTTGSGAVFSASAVLLSLLIPLGSLPPRAGGLGSLPPRAGGATQRYSRWTKTAWFWR